MKGPARINRADVLMTVTDNRPFRGNLAAVWTIGRLIYIDSAVTAPRSVAQLVRAPVSKTGGWGFESLHSCQPGGQA